MITKEIYTDRNGVEQVKYTSAFAGTITKINDVVTPEDGSKPYRFIKATFELNGATKYATGIISEAYFELWEPNNGEDCLVKLDIQSKKFSVTGPKSNNLSDDDFNSLTSELDAFLATQPASKAAVENPA